MPDRPRSSLFRVLRTAFLCAGLATPYGCATMRTKSASAPASMRGKVCHGQRSTSKGVAMTAKLWPSDAIEIAPSAPPGTTRVLRRSHRRVDPVVREWLADLPRNTRRQVLVSYRERVELPRFPDLDPREKRTSAANLARLRTAKRLVEWIQRDRASAYAAPLRRLLEAPGVELIDKLWLAPTYVVELPLGSIATVLRDSEVVYVEPVVGRDSPPSCDDPAPPAMDSSPVDDLIEGLDLIDSEPFRELNFPSGRIGLLDTGVWADHDLLRGGPMAVMADCVHGGVNCRDDGGEGDEPGFDPVDQCRDGTGHGTQAASILVGTDALGPRFRGGLDHTLESYQVYVRSEDCRCDLCLNRHAVARAFQESRIGLVPIIVANIAGRAEEEVSSMCAVADAAYRTGAVVVAATGSEGERVSAPAEAACVIGVGSRELLALEDLDPTQNSGPAENMRFKPDIQGPTGTESARFFPDCLEFDGLVYSFSGTSGATPFAGVAAALLRDYMRAADPQLEPGNVYAGLILSGRHYAPNLNHEEGAGLLELPTQCCLEFGDEEVHVARPAFDIPFDLTGSVADSIEAAIWWPENQQIAMADDEPLNHNDLNLYLIDPNGETRASSTEVWSVFERVTSRVRASERGMWKIRVEVASFWGEGREADLPHSPDRRHKVYWAAAAREE